MAITFEAVHEKAVLKHLHRTILACIASGLRPHNLPLLVPAMKRPAFSDFEFPVIRPAHKVPGDFYGLCDIPRNPELTLLWTKGEFNGPDLVPGGDLD